MTTDVTRLQLRPAQPRPGDPPLADLRAEATRHRLASERRGRLLQEARWDLAGARAAVADRARDLWWGVGLGFLAGGFAGVVAAGCLR